MSRTYKGPVDHYRHAAQQDDDADDLSPAERREFFVARARQREQRHKDEWPERKQADGTIESGFR